ncbi:MAG: hypothetical protein KGL39_14435 [Patescibacteria group bacterium]|nr:hypothetical protein [Patescibacteria group bacterium]
MNPIVEEWNSISNDPSFRSQPLPIQNKVALNFFNGRVAPHVPKEHLEEARNSFFQDAFPAPQAPKQGTIAGNLLGGAAEGATLGFHKSTEPVSSWPQAAARFVGEQAAQLPYWMAGGKLAAPIAEEAAPVLEKLLPTIAEKAPMAIPEALKTGIAATAISPATEEASTHGKASVPDILKAAVAGGASGAVLGGIGGAFMKEPIAESAQEPIQEPIKGPVQEPPKIQTPEQLAEIKTAIKTPEEATAAPMAAKPTVPIGPPKDLADYIRAQGGINPAKSEEFGKDLEALNLPKELISKSGKLSLQDMASRMADKGFINDEDPALAIKALNPNIIGGIDLTNQPDWMQRFAKNVMERSNLNPADKEALVNLAIERRPQLEQIRGPVQTFADVQKAAAQMNIPKESLIEGPGEGKNWSSPQQAVLGKLLYNAQNNVSSLENQIEAGKSTMTPDELGQAKTNLEAAKLERASLLSSFQKQSSDVARTLNARKMILAAAQSPDVRFMQAAIKAVKENVFSPKELSDLADQFKTDPAGAIKKVSARMNQSFFERAQRYYTGNLLLSIGTPLRIGTDNVTNLLTDLPAKTLAAIFEKGKGALGGQEEHTLKEVAWRAVGNGVGFPAGISRAIDFLRSGVNPIDIEDFNIHPYQQEPKTAIEKVSQWGAKLVTAAHLIPRTMVEVGELSSNAIRQAIIDFKAGYIGADEIEQRANQYIANPTEDMIKAVRKAGDRAAYQQKLGEPAQGLKKFIYGDAGKAVAGKYGEGFRPGKYLVPFYNIIFNRAKQAMEWTPIGLSKLADAAPSEKSEIVARTVLGSATAAWFLHGILKGSIQAWGNGPQNATRAQEEAWLMAHGGVRNAVKIGNHVIQMQHLGTLGMALSSVASVADQIKFNRQQPSEHQYLRLGEAFAQGLFDQSYLSNLGQWMDAFREAGQGHALSNALARQGASLAQGFIPGGSAVRQIAGATDLNSNHQMLVRDTGNTFTGDIKSSIPGLAETLPVRRDVLGHQIVRHTNPMIPVLTSLNGTDPKAEWMAKTGLEWQLPNRTMGHLKSQLDPADYENFVRLRGQYLDRVVTALMQRGYQPTPQAIPIIKRTVSEALRPLDEYYSNLADAMAVHKTLGIPLQNGKKGVK